MCLHCNGLLNRLAGSLVHVGCAQPAFSAMRARIIAQARGAVVEIGFGSGLNLPHYRANRVGRVLAVEPDPHMAARAGPMLQIAEVPVALVEARGEAIPLPDAVADTVVLGYVLCTVNEPAAVLAEARRVLKPGGRLLFCEHAAAQGSMLRAMQTACNGIWKVLAGGCNLGRDPLHAIETAGFRCDEVRCERFTGLLSLLGRNIGGVAALDSASRAGESPCP